MQGFDFGKNWRNGVYENRKNQLPKLMIIRKGGRIRTMEKWEIRKCADLSFSDLFLLILNQRTLRES
jgi:hypothetical protein